MIQFDMNVYIEYRLNLDSNIFYSFCRIGFAHIGRVGSVFITVAITVERYLSVCHPNIECKGKCLLVPVPVILAIIYNIPKFFELETISYNYESTNESNNHFVANETFYDDHNQTYVIHEVEDIGYRGTALRLNHWYVVLYVFWSKFLLVEIIPWVTVIVLNVCIWRKIKEFKRIRRETLRKDEGNFQWFIYTKVKISCGL